MHSAGAAGLGVQGRLEHPAEDRGADARPVGLPWDVEQENQANVVGEVGDLDHIAEQAAIDVREALEILVEVGVALGDRGVEDGEEILKCSMHLESVVLIEVVEEHILAEQARVLGVEAEHEKHAQHVEECCDSSDSGSM